MKKDAYDIYVWPHILISSFISSIVMIILILFLFNIVPDLLIIVGPAFGVVFGFILKDYSYERYKDNGKRKYYLKLLNKNITDIIKDLKTKDADLISEDVWTTCLNSGDLRLFTHDQAGDLYDAYFYVQVHNYNAVRFVNGLLSFDKIEINNKFLLQKLENLKDKDWFKID